jgi:hypothetical protein
MTFLSLSAISQPLFQIRNLCVSGMLYHHMLNAAHESTDVAERRSGSTTSTRPLVKPRHYIFTGGAFIFCYRRKYEELVSVSSMRLYTDLDSSTACTTACTTVGEELMRRTEPA